VIRLGGLDPKLWMALAMPTRGTELDARTLELLDTDKDGRIRVPEVLAAVDFVEKTFREPDEVVRGGESLPLGGIRDARLQAAAKRVLASIGKQDAAAITLADVTAHAEVVAKLPLNGDGVLPPGSAGDAEVAKVIQDIIDTVGGVEDLGGTKGVNQATVDAFFAQAQAYVDWLAKGEADKGLLPLGDATFAPPPRSAPCAPRSTTTSPAAASPPSTRAPPPRSNGSDADYAALAGRDLGPGEAAVAKLPVARVEAGRPMPLADGVNPAWSAPLAAFAAARRRCSRPASTSSPRRLDGAREQARGAHRLGGGQAGHHRRQARRRAAARDPRRAGQGQARRDDRRRRPDRRRGTRMWSRSSAPCATGRACARCWRTSSTSRASTGARARRSRRDRSSSTGAAATCACRCPTPASTPRSPAWPRPSSPTAR
jgi:hypothetical protein